MKGLPVFARVWNAPPLSRGGKEDGIIKWPKHCRQRCGYKFEGMTQTTTNQRQVKGFIHRFFGTFLEMSLLRKGTTQGLGRVNDKFSLTTLARPFSPLRSGLPHRVSFDEE